nr:MAG TPA: hypothetical protein [Caudoviricetes sp.]
MSLYVLSRLKPLVYIDFFILLDYKTSFYILK